MAIDIFISWSGLRSRHLGIGLRDWIHAVLPDVHAWMSDTDVPAGEPWINMVIENIHSARAMIICLTPENQDSRWLHFELGLAIGKPIIPVLFDHEPGEVPAPLGTFNCCIADRRGIEKLTSRLAAVLSRKVVEQSFEKAWPDLAAALEKITYLSSEHITPSGAYRGHLTAIGLTPFVALKYMDKLADAEMREKFVSHSSTAPRSAIELLQRFAVGQAVSSENSFILQHLMWMFATHSSLDYLHYVWDGEWAAAAKVMVSLSSRKKQST